MKKSLIAIAALAATSAFAQSSVTLSGVADVGLQFSSVSKKNVFLPTTNAGQNAAGTVLNANLDNVNALKLSSGNNNRLVFAGAEDLGGGMAATFAAQLRFDPTNGFTEGGGARPLFQGESTVGLRGAFGAVKLGRALTAVQLPNGGIIDPWGVTTVAGMPYAAGFATSYEAGGEGRIGNAVFYTTPNFSGFSGNVSLGFNKGPTGKTHSAFAGIYSNGPLNAMLGFENNNVKDSLVQLGANYDMGAAKLYFGYGAVKGGAAADRAGVTFAAGASTAFIGGLNNTALAGQGVVAPDGKVTSLTFGAGIPFGAATVRVGYAQVKGDVVGAVRTDADTKLGLGVVYSLSKRTSIYSNIASITNKKVLDNSVAGTTGASKTAFDLGIAHSF
jgi:predicted porin